MPRLSNINILTVVFIFLFHFVHFVLPDDDEMKYIITIFPFLFPKLMPFPGRTLYKHAVHIREQCAGYNCQVSSSDNA